MNRDNRPCRKAGFFILRPAAGLCLALLAQSAFSAAPADSTGAASIQGPAVRHVLPDYSYFKSYFIDTKNIACAPAGWRWQQWTAATLVAGCGAGVYFYDREIMDVIQNHRNKGLDNVASVARMFGTGRYVIPIAGAMYLGGYVFKNSKLERTALLGLESMAISGIFTEMLKITCHRHRPRESVSPDIWDGPGLSDEFKSFPSGHSMATAAMATVVALEYRDTPAIGAIACTIAAATGWSRMNDNAHWASDVFAGFTIGYCFSRVIVSSRAGGKVGVTPGPEGQGAGIALTGVW